MSEGRLRGDRKVQLRAKTNAVYYAVELELAAAAFHKFGGTILGLKAAHVT